MPKTVFDKKSRYIKLHSLLRGAADTAGKNYDDIGLIIGRNKNTVTQRFMHPGNFTLDELLSIGRALNLTIEEIRQSIMY